jgi:dynein heavy chain 1
MYATVLDTVAPLKAEMDILEAAAAKGQTKLNALEADAKEIEDKIAKYKEEYALLISEAQVSSR